MDPINTIMLQTPNASAYKVKTDEKVNSVINILSGVQQSHVYANMAAASFTTGNPYLATTSFTSFLVSLLSGLNAPVQTSVAATTTDKPLATATEGSALPAVADPSADAKAKADADAKAKADAVAKADADAKAQAAKVVKTAADANESLRKSKLQECKSLGIDVKDNATIEELDKAIYSQRLAWEKELGFDVSRGTATRMSNKDLRAKVAAKKADVDRYSNCPQAKKLQQDITQAQADLEKAKTTAYGRGIPYAQQRIKKMQDELADVKSGKSAAEKEKEGFKTIEKINLLIENYKKAGKTGDLAYQRNIKDAIDVYFDQLKSVGKEINNYETSYSKEYDAAVQKLNAISKEMGWTK